MVSHGATETQRLKSFKTKKLKVLLCELRASVVKYLLCELGGSVVKNGLT